MAVKKVIINGQTKVDLTDTTATAENVVQGKVFHDASGELVTGTNTDALKAKSYGILMGSGEEPDQDMYFPYIETFYNSYQFPILGDEYLRHPNLTNITYNLYFSKGPTYGCADVFGSLGIFAYNLKSLHFTEGIEEYISTKPAYYGMVQTPKDCERDGQYYWGYFEGLHQYFYSYEGTFIKGKDTKNCENIDEVVDLSKITSLSTFSWMWTNNYKLAGTQENPIIFPNVEYIYAQGGDGLSYAIFSEGLKEIGTEGLKTISYEWYTLPSTVEFIGADAFSYSSISTLILQSQTPPQNSFTSWSSVIPETGMEVIYVPAGTGEAYRSSTGWSNYGDIIYEIGSTESIRLGDEDYRYEIGDTWGEFAEYNSIDLERIGNDSRYRSVYADEPISPRQNYSIQ